MKISLIGKTFGLAFCVALGACNVNVTENNNNKDVDKNESSTFVYEQWLGLSDTFGSQNYFFLASSVDGVAINQLVAVEMYDPSENDRVDVWDEFNPKVESPLSEDSADFLEQELAGRISASMPTLRAHLSEIVYIYSDDIQELAPRGSTRTFYFTFKRSDESEVTLSQTVAFP